MGLVEKNDGQLLFSPLSNAIKTKYTCIAASSNHVILGANTGGLYCFTANNFRYVGLLANKEGSVSFLRFSPDGKTLAVVVGGCSVCFWELNLEDESGESKRFHVSLILKGGVVTEMVWDIRGTRLIYGDNQGRVAIAFIPKFSRKFGSSSLFKKVDEIIHIEKSAIVQLDMCQDMLLVATTQRSCLLKLRGEIVENVIQVGTRPRDGPYGALFHPRWVDHPPVIYSARPKGRMWEADITGTVRSTVKQRDLITKNPSISSIITLTSHTLSTSPPPHKIPNLNFHHLQLINNKYLLAWQEGYIFIFHPSSYTLCCWTNIFKDIVQVNCVDEKMYILHENCQKITCISLLNMEEVLQALQSTDNLPLYHQLMLAHNDVIKDDVINSNTGKQLVAKALHSIVQSGVVLEEELQEIYDSLLPNELIGHNDINEETSLTEDHHEISYKREDTKRQVRNGDDTREQEKITSDNVMLVTECTSEHKSLKQKVEEVVMVSEDDGLFSMEGGYDEEDGSKNQNGNSSEDTSYHGNKPDPPLSTNHLPHSISTSHIITPHPQTTPTIHSLPINLDYTQPAIIPTKPSPQTPTSYLPLSPPSTLMSPSQPPPLSVHMRGKMKEEDNVGIVAVRDVKKKRGRSRKKKNFDVRTSSRQSSFPTSQQDLEDILEGDFPLPMETSPSTSQMSSGNPSLDNSPHHSRGSSPQRLETINSSTNLNMDRRLSVPVITDVPEEEHVVHRSMSVDPLVDTRDMSSHPRSQSIDIDIDLSRLGLQKPSILLSKVKSMATTQQERTGRKMKELLSSLSPMATSVSSSSTHIPGLSHIPSPTYSVVPVATVISPSSSEQSLGLLSPSPEIGTLPTDGEDNIDECDYHSPLISSPFSTSPVAPSSNIDPETQQFITSTNTAMSLMDSPMVLSSPDQLRTTLEQWREKLEIYYTHLHTTSEHEGERGCVFITPLYSNLSESIRHCITELSTLYIENKMIDESSSDSLIQFISQYSSILNTSRTKQCISHLPLSVMSACWRQLVDNDIHHHIAGSDVVTGPLGNVDEMKVAIDKYPLVGPRLLQKVYQEDVTMFLRLCSSSSSILPWEVAVLCNLDNQEATPTNQVDTKTYSEYLDAVLSVENDRSLTESSLLENKELFLISVKVLLTTPPNDRVLNERGRPLPHSHLVQWPYQTSLTRLTSLSVMTTDDIKEQMIDLFQKNGYWSGLLDLYINMMKITRDLLSVIIDLYNMEIIHKISKNNLLTSPKVWNELLEILISHDTQVLSHDTSHDLTLEGVVREMVSVLGIEETGNVLSQVKDVCGDIFPHTLHEFLVGVATVHREQRSTSHLLLEKLDRHLWSSRPIALGPQLQAIYKSESISHTPYEHTTPPSINTFIEDAGSHWGICANSERCPVCGFPILSNISEKGSGLLAFHCGHVYHRSCIPEQACLICFVSKYSLYLNNVTK